MAITLDGTTGITLPASGDISNIDLIKSSTDSPTIFQNTSGTEIGTLCRAWVNFKGRDTVSIDAAFNVSTITDLGVGAYRVSFTNTMPNISYCVVGGASTDAISKNGLVLCPDRNNVNTTVSSFQITTLSFNADPAGGVYDPISVHVAVFR